MSPVRNAMRLVNGIERDVHIIQDGNVLLLGQALRRHVEKLRHAGFQVCGHFGDLSLVQ